MTNFERGRKIDDGPRTSNEQEEAQLSSDLKCVHVVSRHHSIALLLDAGC
jgi:hypothetical protein